MFLLAAVSHTHPVTLGWKWVAVGIAIGFLVFLWVVVSLLAGNWNPLKLAHGTDGPLSTSKFQWLLWLVAVLFVYVALLVIRFKQGNYGAINNVPVNVLIVLGFSTTTAVAAKGITVAQVQNNQVDKTQAAGGLFSNDQNLPDIAKTQMLGFTFVAIGVFIAAFIHQLAKNPPTTSLPNIDASLLVLMGLSQGGYVGKKLVSIGAAALYDVNPTQGDPSTQVTAVGNIFGSSQDGSQLTLDGGVVRAPNIISWSDKSIGFTIPAQDPARNKDWDVAQEVAVRVIVNGQSTNSVTFTVKPPVLNPPAAADIAVGDLGRREIAVAGRNLGDHPGQLRVNGAILKNPAPTWSDAQIRFTMPRADPASKVNRNFAAGDIIPVEAVVNGHTSNTIQFTVTP